MSFCTPAEIFALAKDHVFYQSRLSELDCFEQAPTIDKATLYQCIAEAIKDPEFCRGLYLSPTGGSTGRSLLYPTALADNQFQREALLPFLLDAGIFRADMIALNLFGSTMLYRSLEIFNYFCEKAGGTALPVSSLCPDREALNIAALYHANTVMGNTSRLLQLARLLQSDKQGGSHIKIDRIIYGGEALPPFKRAYLLDAFSASEITGIFGSAESGIWGFQPASMAGEHYLYPRSLMHVEIVDNSADFGRMILTNLVRRRNPLLRYDCGDMARLVPDQSSELGHLELAGRVESSFSIGGDYYDLAEFAAILMRADNQNVLDFQIELTSLPHKNKDQIRFAFVLADRSACAQRVIVALLDAWIEANDNLFVRILDFVEMADLQRSNTAQKVIRIIDRR